MTDEFTEMRKRNPDHWFELSAVGVSLPNGQCRWWIDADLPNGYDKTDLIGMLESSLEVLRG